MSYNRRARPPLPVKRSLVFGVPMVNSAYSESHPWDSLGLSCHPQQVEERNQEYARLGMNARHLPNGILRATTREGRNEALRFHGAHDNDASYGDVNE